MRDIENVFLETLFINDKCGGSKELFYIDDTFTVINSRIERFIELCDKCRIKFTWRCESRVDAMVKNQDLLEGMKRSGCKRIQFGIESGNQQVLDNIRKQMKLADALELLINREAGYRCGNQLYVCSLLRYCRYDE